MSQNRGGGGGGAGPPPPPPQEIPAVNFTSQGDAHVRNDAQIKLLHYTLYAYICVHLNDLI